MIRKAKCDKVMTYLLENEMYVVVNLHRNPEFNVNESTVRVKRTWHLVPIHQVGFSVATGCLWAHKLGFPKGGGWRAANPVFVRLCRVRSLE